MILKSKRVMTKPAKGKASQRLTIRVTVAMFKLLKYKEAPTIANTVTQLVDCGTLSILAKNKLTAAPINIISATSKEKYCAAKRHELKVLATRPPTIKAPMITNTLNKSTAHLRRINLPQ